MTSKERAALRAKANSEDALFQIGKGGLSDSLLKQTEDALKARELIKLRVLLESTPISAREAADSIAATLGAEVVQVIGGVIVLYRFNPELHKDEKKKPAVKPKSKQQPMPDIRRAGKPNAKRIKH